MSYILTSDEKIVELEKKVVELTKRVEILEKHLGKHEVLPTQNNEDDEENCVVQ